MPCSYRIERQDIETGDAVVVECPFAVPENELLRLKDRNFCLYHLPHNIKINWKSTDEELKKHNSGILNYILTSTAEDRTIELSNIFFPTFISFRVLKIKKISAANFQSAHFKEGADFGGIVFTKYVNFNQTTFSGLANFDNSKFDGIASFVRSVFEGPTSFRKCHFSSEAIFGININHDITFSESTFSSSSNFSNCVFSKAVFFEGVKFYGKLDFVKATFRARVIFSRSIFGGLCDYSHASFEGPADFNSSRFDHPTEFTGAAFLDWALFNRTQFKSHVSFEGTKADQSETRRSDNFQYALFGGASFLGHARFANRIFHNETSFRNAKFHRAPTFHNCNLHQDTEFRGAKFFDRSADSERAYRTLKLAMESTRARYEQSEFFEYEQQCRRQRLWEDRNWGNWLASTLYEMTASYGQSFLRPLGCLLGLIILFFLFYVWIAHSVEYVPAHDVLVFAIEQVFRPFHIWAGNSTRLDWVINMLSASPILLRTLATLQSLITLGLFALSLVALRRRFHMI